MQDTLFDHEHDIHHKKRQFIVSLDLVLSALTLGLSDPLFELFDLELDLVFHLEALAVA